MRTRSARGAMASWRPPVRLGSGGHRSGMEVRSLVDP